MTALNMRWTAPAHDASPGGMGRYREISFRLLNNMLLRATAALHRGFGIRTTYCVNGEHISAEFEGSRYIYSTRNRGCTGNIDYDQAAEDATRHKIFSMLGGDEVFYDIGAHGGVYTISLMRRFPGLSVYSFEPQPAELLANLALNRIDADRVQSVAVGHSPGEIRMTTKFRSSNHMSDAGDAVVRCVRLDDYAEERALALPDWIKIDIEGMEFPALKGAEGLLRKARPTVICEINHLFGRYGTVLEDLLGYMQDLGYGIYRLHDGLLDPVTGRAGTLSDLGPSDDCNFWFVHASRQTGTSQAVTSSA